jgi:hypothetical protein
MPHSISFRKKDTENEGENVKNIVNSLSHSIPKTIKHFFPNFKNQLRKIEDYRKRTDYELSEILMGAISLFLFKEGSRNAYNAERKDKDFLANYEKLFRMSLPHMDTVDDVFRVINPEELEKQKVKMVRSLIEKKVLHKWRLDGKYFVVAVDATGVASYTKRHCKKCLSKESKNGKKSWFHNVLEAKLVLPNGLTISLGTEWIENDKVGYDKQDCEIKAFDRLAKKLKKNFPRLPICIVGDGLYPNQRTFGICKRNRWEYIIVLKEGNLPMVWEEVKSLLQIEKDNKLQVIQRNKKEEKTNNYRWINGIDYKGYKLNWISNKEIITTDKEETTKNYVHISSFKINKKRVAQISFSGRMRWKIENEGFNEQKNNGYQLEHKYSEVSLRATKNYYQSLQIACIINQLLEQGQKLKRYLKEKITIKHLWKRLLAFLTYGKVDEEKLSSLMSQRNQIRLD